MVEQVTDPDILAQLEGGGDSPVPDEPAPAIPQPTEDVGAEAGGDPAPSVATDVAKQVVAGVPSAFAQAAGLPGDARSFLMGAGEKLADKVGVPPNVIVAARNAAGWLPGMRGPTTQDVKDTAHNVTGITLPEAKTREGQYARSITEFVANPISYAGPGSAFMKLAQAASAGAGSEYAGGLFEGREGQPYAKVLGAVLGAIVPRAAARLVTPLPIPANKQASVDILAGEGVTPTAGQQSGSKALRYAESELGDSPGAGAVATREQERIGREYTNAILARVGERWRPNERITEVVDRAHNRNGQMFDNLARNTNSAYDNQYVNDLWVARDTYEHLFTNPLTAPMVERVMEHATNKLVQNRAMDGAEYQALRSRIERHRRSTRDPELQEYYASVRQAMDDLVERNATPELMQAWRETRNQYRNILVLDRIAGAAGQEAAQGHFSPAQLRGAAKAQHGARNYARGHGDFADLARAGEDVLTPLPQSGTAPRSYVRNVLAGLGAGLGYAHGDPGSVVAGAVAGAGVPAAVGRTLMSRPAQGFLRNQVMTGALRRGSGQSSAALRAAINARRSDEEDEE